MDDKNLTARRQLIRLLRAGLRGEDCPPPEEDLWTEVLELAAAQRMENLLWYALRGRDDLPRAAARRLELAHNRAVFAAVQIDAWLARIGEAMSRRGVECVPLRGAVLRDSYPARDMRPMADLDYLVRTGDYPVIRQAMEELGGKHIHTDGGHFTFVVPPGLHVEFHPNLVYVMSPAGTQINPGWQYVRDGRLTAEGSYLNHICHLASDLTRGGAGVRAAMDDWIFRHGPADKPDWELVDRRLEQFGLLAFARNLEGLADWWFGDGREAETPADLGEYLLDSGAHGTVRQAVLAESACWGGAGSVLRRIFYPMEEMRGRYPWLKERPWLLPAAWVLRGAHTVRTHGPQVRSWFRSSRETDETERRAFRRRLERFGLLLPDKTGRR